MLPKYCLDHLNIINQYTLLSNFSSDDLLSLKRLNHVSSIERVKVTISCIQKFRIEVEKKNSATQLATASVNTARVFLHKKIKSKPARIDSTFVICCHIIKNIPGDFLKTFSIDKMPSAYC